MVLIPVPATIPRFMAKFFTLKAMPNLSWKYIAIIPEKKQSLTCMKEMREAKLAVGLIHVRKKFAC